MGHECRKIFNSLAHKYENEWAGPGPARKRIREIVSFFGIKKGMKVIEPGCGRGDFSPFILEKIGGRGRLFAADVSEKMAHYAGHFLKPYENAEIAVSCASRLKYKKNAADMVICFNCFPHFYPKHKFLAEFYRVLKPGGSLIIAHDMERRVINKIHKSSGFNMERHSLPARPVLQRLLSRNDFKIIKYKDSGFYMLKAIKIL
jgi:ubiquinone/menaquinone biosynthesis C-methylase UbiE